MKSEDCPRVDLHTKCPKSYLAWHEWAEENGKTHRQIKCPMCGFYSIWLPLNAPMALIQQPEGSSLCGQCVVAMLAGITLDLALILMGDGRNYPKDIRLALNEVGMDMTRRGIPPVDYHGPDGKQAAALVMSKVGGRKYTHWIAWDGEHWLDPRLGAIGRDYRFGYADAEVGIYVVKQKPQDQ